MDTLPLVSLGLGFILGVRHAMDPDHVAAVSALLSQHRSLARSCLLGTFWGVGHTMALLAAGVAVIVFKLTISPEVAKGMEMAVAVVLILLGGHVLRRSLGVWSFHRHEHSHDGRPHSHFHLYEGTEDSPGHIHLLKGGGRPFLVGFVHGMAGSAALMLLVLTAIPSPVRAFLYILVFGIGSTAGMLVLSGLIGIPFVVTADRSRAVHAIIQALAGAASLILGLALAWNLGVTAFVQCSSPGVRSLPHQEIFFVHRPEKKFPPQTAIRHQPERASKPGALVRNRGVPATSLRALFLG